MEKKKISMKHWCSAQRQQPQHAQTVPCTSTSKTVITSIQRVAQNNNKTQQNYQIDFGSENENQFFFSVCSLKSNHTTKKKKQKKNTLKKEFPSLLDPASGSTVFSPNDMPLVHMLQHPPSLVVYL
jgi:hypothetical protein